MWRVLREAFLLYVRNLPSVAAVALAVWAPARLLLAWITGRCDAAGNEGASFLVEAWGNALVEPLAVAALVWLYDRRARGEKGGVLGALGAGLRRWIPLFCVWLGAGVMIALGLLAGLIPGLVLMVRYALIDCVVVLEERGFWPPRKRSAALTHGVGWRLAGLMAFWMSLLGIAEALAYPALNFVPALNLAAGEFLADCAVDVLGAAGTAILYVVYAAERRVEAGGPPGG